MYINKTSLYTHLSIDHCTKSIADPLFQASIIMWTTEQIMESTSFICVYKTNASMAVVLYVAG